jgi:hypothetical protein
MRYKSFFAWVTGFGLHYLKEISRNILAAEVNNLSTCTDFEFVPVYHTCVGNALTSVRSFDFFFEAVDLASVRLRKESCVYLFSDKETFAVYRNCPGLQ